MYGLPVVSRTILLALKATHYISDLAGSSLGWFQHGQNRQQILSEPPKLVPGSPYNTFDGPGFPACHQVKNVYDPTTVDEMIQLVKMAASNGTHVRASGKGHMWYDTMCSDDSNTIIIRTESVNGISDLVLNDDVGSVVVEAGVTFLQLADWLHARGASTTYTLVNWNITIAGAVASGSHRSSLSENSQVSAAALALDIINGKGDLVHLDKDESDDWLAATTSLGLLGIIARVKFQVVADFKVYANQTILDEDEVLNSDIFAEISPYVTANYWWWPGLRKFHLRTYNPVPIDIDGNAFQSTFSVTALEGKSALFLLNSGQSFYVSNFLAERIFYDLWCSPNFHDKITNKALTSWPVYGWAYDVLIGGLYPDQRPEWEYNLHGKTLELAVPVTQANAFLKRIRELFDETSEERKPVTSTYRSGINIKFGKAFNSFLSQTYKTNSDWSKGVVMFDFPSFLPTRGDHHRYNEEFYTKLARTLIDEFPVRPHWTKNTREVLGRSVKNLDPDALRRFKSVREKYDPHNIFKSVVGEIIGVI